MAVDPENLSAAATRLYEQVRHLEIGDPNGEPPQTAAELGYPWATICAALCAPIDPLYDLLAVPEHPWTVGMDLDTAPDWILPWLANFNGAEPPAGLTPAELRAYIRDAPGKRRGRPGAIRAAVKATLSGTQYVSLIERLPPTSDGYTQRVTTRSNETPSPTLTAARARTQEPGGVVLEFVTTPGLTYAEAEARWGSLPAANVESMFATAADAEAVV